MDLIITLYTGRPSLSLLMSRYIIVCKLIENTDIQDFTRGDIYI